MSWAYLPILRHLLAVLLYFCNPPAQADSETVGLSRWERSPLEGSSSTYCSRGRPTRVRSVCLGPFIVILSSRKRVSAASVGSWYQYFITFTVKWFFLMSGWNFFCCHLCPWPLVLCTNVGRQGLMNSVCVQGVQRSCKDIRNPVLVCVYLLMIISSHFVLLIILPKVVRFSTNPSIWKKVKWEEACCGDTSG